MASVFVAAAAMRGWRRANFWNASFFRLRHKINMRESRTLLRGWTDLGRSQCLPAEMILGIYFVVAV
jgi:hypothetical protein